MNIELDNKSSVKGRQLLRIVPVAFIAAIFLLLAILQTQQFNEAQGVRQEVDYSSENRRQILALLSAYQDLETGQRGFVVTGNDAFLEPYRSALVRIPLQLATLRGRFGNQRDSAGNLAELSQISSRQLIFYSQIVGLRQEGKADAAAALISSGRGKANMDAIRKSIARLDALERARLQKRAARAETSRTKIQRLTASLEALLLLLLVGAGWIIYCSMVATRAALEKLSDLSSRQEAIFDAATDGMITHDLNGDIQSLNPAAAHMYGYRIEDLVGRNLSVLFKNPPKQEALEHFLEVLAENPAGLGAGNQQFGAKRRDGSVFTVDVATSPVRTGEGLCFVAVIRDVTERSRTERMKTEFVSTVSHELRTPLTSIAGSLGLLAGGAAGKLPARAEKLIGIAHANSVRLVRLINDILDVEKIESGKMSFEIKPVALRPLVEKAIRENLGYAAKYGVSLRLADGGGDPAVLGDADRLTQVLTNLLSNASKFSTKGSEVVATLVPGQSSHRVTIADRGSGIPDEFRERIFSKFAQADASDTRQKGGTGLGLSIVKQIVEALGGAVSFDSEPGKGTAFHVDLPSAAKPVQGRKARVLVCQTNPSAGEEMRRALRQAGLSVDVATSGDELRTLTAKKTYAVIVLDLLLPGEEPIDLINDLRSDPRYASTAILVASPDEASGDISRALSVIDWMHKPVSIDRLVTGVQEAVPGRDRPLILHVEDDADVIRVVATAFEGKADLDAVLDLQFAREALGAKKYDLVILDLALPGGSGVELLSEMQRDGLPIPVVIFSAQDEDPELAKRVDASLTKSRASLDDLVGTVERLIGQRNVQPAEELQ